MRLFFTRRAPEATRVLLIESGPREIAERVIPRIREAFGERTPIDLLCCRPGEPDGLLNPAAPGPKIWRTADCSRSAQRRRMLLEIRSRRHPIAAIVFADDPTMGRWKWAALALLPAKTLIVNENADFFWLEWSNWRLVSRLLRQRSGLGADSAVRSAARILALPLSFVFLLGYAAWVHAVRTVRLALGIKHKTREIGAG